MSNKFTLITIIANTQLSEDEKNILLKHIESFSEEQISLLIYVFKMESKSIKAYLDFLNEYNSENQPVPTQRVEEIIEKILEKI